VIARSVEDAEAFAAWCIENDIQEPRIMVPEDCTDLPGHENHKVVWSVEGFYSLLDSDDAENGIRYCDPYCVTCDMRLDSTTDNGKRQQVL
jgi:hypothetical protein